MTRAPVLPSAMSDMGLLGMIAALHVVALAGGAVLMRSLLRADNDGRDDATSDGPPDHDDRPPPNGPPLLDARQAPIRLREPERLADRLPTRPRRPQRTPPDRHKTRRAPTAR